jgi:hypothetical protein
MSAMLERRRVLLTAEDGERERLRALFGDGPLRDWDVVEADSCERAHFAHQLHPCDVLVVGGSTARKGPGLAWLAGRGGPVLFLADARPEEAAEALRQGADCWLPRTPALEHPALLAAALERLAEFGTLERRAEAAAGSLRECHRQVDRLVALLWQAVPGAGRAHWLSQRHVLERFEEEVERSRRHGGALAVVRGEVRGAGDSQELAAWTARQVGAAKRRCDVAGQYGLQGFLMLLPHTPEAGAAACCRRLRTLLQPPGGGAGPRPPLHAAFGVAGFTPAASTVQGLLRRAEESLDEARAGDRLAQDWPPPPGSPR